MTHMTQYDSYDTVWLIWLTVTHLYIIGHSFFEALLNLVIIRTSPSVVWILIWTVKLKSSYSLFHIKHTACNREFPPRSHCVCRNEGGDLKNKISFSRLLGGSASLRCSVFGGGRGGEIWRPINITPVFIPTFHVKKRIHSNVTKCERGWMALVQ